MKAPEFEHFDGRKRAGVRFINPSTVVLLTQTISGVRLVWRVTGSARWDDTHGLYACSGFPDGFIQPLQDAIKAARVNA